MYVYLKDYDYELYNDNWTTAGNAYNLHCHKVYDL